MSLLSLKDVSVSFGGPVLLDRVTFQLHPGERVCLVGRNGTGKSTLLRIMAGELVPDEGQLSVANEVVISRLPQAIPDHLAGTATQIVAGGVPRQGALLTEYAYVAQQLAAAPDEALLRRLETIQSRLEAEDAWDIYRRIEALLQEVQVPVSAPFDTLSGGLKRKVLLARALVAEPTVLLLDEPTNHLDIEAIEWLEERLKRYGGTLCFVTHDRMLMRHLATRIIELDRGRLQSWSCDYETFLERREELLANEAARAATLDKRIAQEETWARQGIKARRTRNEGRLRALARLKEERAARRQELGQARLRVQTAQRSGESVIEAEGIHFAYGEQTLVRDFSTRIKRRDKIGLLGPNGSGKTTLLKLLLGQLEPLGGTVRHGTELAIAYYDQLRVGLDDERRVVDTIADGREVFVFNGRTTHVYAYLEDFLFDRDRARTPVSVLSGGERNRLALAHLFTQPANVLVLDEPTNDLDVDTLELLERLLMEFKGTVLLVSHDREFLNHVVTSSLVLSGEGEVVEYAGGYDDYLAQRPSVLEEPPAKASKVPRQRTERPRKLTFKESRELADLERSIESLEAEKEALFETMADPAFYRQEGERIAAARLRSEALEGELDAAYQRWQELETIRERFEAEKNQGTQV